jgi:hypothetical protein
VAVEDEVVARGLPRCEVGCFGVELHDGDEGRERTVGCRGPRHHTLFG